MTMEIITEPATGRDTSTLGEHPSRHLLVQRGTYTEPTAYFPDLRFTVNGLLDTHKCIESLYDLITQKWPVVGSEVVADKSGKVEFRRPKSFDNDSRPFLVDSFVAPADVSLSSCCTRLPDLETYKADENLISFLNTGELREDLEEILTREPWQSKRALQCSHRTVLGGALRLTAKTVVNSGLPMLTVVFYLFPHSNETLVRVIFPHVMFDASSFGALLRAWSLTVNGKIDEVPKVLSLHELPSSMSDINANSNREDKATVKPPKGYYYMTPIAIVLLLLSLVWRRIIVPMLKLRLPTKSSPGLIFISNKRLQSWRDEAHVVHKTTAKEHWLSDNDLITAWFIQQMAKERTSRLDGWLTPHFAFNVRTQSLLFGKMLGYDLSKVRSRTEALQNAKAVFLHNYVLSSNLDTVSWRNVSRMPVWTLAYRMRAFVESARKPQNEQDFMRQLDEFESLHRSSRTSTPMTNLPIVAEAIVTTNWLQADPVGAIDFTSAVLTSKGNGTPPNTWAARTPKGRASELHVSEELVKKSPPVVTYICISHARKGKGVFANMIVDSHYHRKALFGTTVDLMKAWTTKPGRTQ